MGSWAVYHFSPLHFCSSYWFVSEILWCDSWCLLTLCFHMPHVKITCPWMEKKTQLTLPHICERTEWESLALTSQPPLFLSMQALENVKNHSRHHHELSITAGKSSLSRQGFGYMNKPVITHLFDYFALSASNKASSFHHFLGFSKSIKKEMQTRGLGRCRWEQIFRTPEQSNMMQSAVKINDYD